MVALLRQGFVWMDHGGMALGGGRYSADYLFCAGLRLR
jgi:hypothetical protein